jgi:hypothetical protein
MKKPIKVTPKKRRGRPATGRDPHITSPMPPGLIAEVEAWARANETTRSEAIRRIVELGLAVKSRGRPKRGETKQRARELAGAAVDEMTDTTANFQDQAIRKRRLIKGPTEFREERIDQPKAKWR